MAPHSSTLAWKIPWTEEPGGLQSMGVAKSWTWQSDFPFTFHFHTLEKEMATHSRVLAWRIPGMGEPGGLPSLGSHRVRHDWSDLAAAAYRYCSLWQCVNTACLGELESPGTLVWWCLCSVQFWVWSSNDLNALQKVISTFKTLTELPKSSEWLWGSNSKSLTGTYRKEKANSTEMNRNLKHLFLSGSSSFWLCTVCLVVRKVSRGRDESFRVPGHHFLCINLGWDSRMW